MSDELKSTNYPHQDPSALPVNWNAKPELPWDRILTEVGFDPRVNESVYGQLSAEWNGHAEGSVVLSGLHGDPRWFTIIDMSSLLPVVQKPYSIQRRPLHRQRRLFAYELALANPETQAIYPAAPRVRCRPDQLADCRKQFQKQAKAWAQGQQVPWSPYLPQA